VCPHIPWQLEQVGAEEGGPRAWMGQKDEFHGGGPIPDVGLAAGEGVEWDSAGIMGRETAIWSGYSGVRRAEGGSTVVLCRSLDRAWGWSTSRQAGSHVARSTGRGRGTRCTCSREQALVGGGRVRTRSLGGSVSQIWLGAALVARLRV